MSVFSTVDSRDHTVETFYASAPITWTFQSGSEGIQIIDPADDTGELLDAVFVERATNTPSSVLDLMEPVSLDAQEHLLYSSIKHIFYTNQPFISGSTVNINSPAPLSDNSYVFSVGSPFYGDKILEGSVEIAISGSLTTITDDEQGNLFVNDTPVGNVFYRSGIIVIYNDVDAVSDGITTSGLALASGSEFSLSYETAVEVNRHQINVRLRPSIFNWSLLNPSVSATTFVKKDSAVESTLLGYNVEPIQSPVYQGSMTGSLYSISTLMSLDIIKPYITTIGLYNELYELLAVAKLSTPIQRTFDTDQIFIVRFDV
jgi:hypothetical protein